MKEYIERDKVIDELNKISAYFDSGDIRYGVQISLGEVKKILKADVKEVVHAKWEIYMKGIYIQCSECFWGTSFDIPLNYCPNCGAKMEI